MAQVTDDPADSGPVWSPDEKWLAFSSTRTGASHIWRIPSAGGERTQVSEEEGWTPRWSPDGKSIYFIALGANAGDIWATPVEGGSARRLTDLSGRRGAFFFAMATDGRYIYFAWREGLGDIWVADFVYQ